MQSPHIPDAALESLWVVGFRVCFRGSEGANMVRGLGFMV